MTRIDRQIGDEGLVEAAVAHYEACLATSGAGLALLGRLGVDAELRARCRLGVADRTFGRRLPVKQVAAGRHMRGVLERVGLLRSSGHERLCGMLVVPVFDGDGRLVQAYGRRLQGPSTTRAVTTSLPRPPAAWDPGGALGGSQVVLATDPLLGLALMAAGVTAVVACVGGDVALPVARVSRVIVVGLERDADEVARLEAVDREWGADVVTVCVPGRLGQFAGPALAALLEPALADTGGETGIDTGIDTDAGVDRGRHPAPQPKPLPTTQAPAEPRTQAPAAPPSNEETPPPDAHPDERTYVFDERRWRVRGLEANRARGTLRLNVMVRRGDGAFHLDALDLCVARRRHAFVQAAAGELGVPEPVLKRDLGRVLLALEEAQDLMLARLEQPETDEPLMSDRRREAALALLRSPDLLERCLADLDALGVVGERDNLLVLLLTIVSRVLDRPLAVVVQSTPAAGKTNLVQAVLSLVPEERRHVYTAITGQSLYYMGATDLRHGVLCLAEEAGVGRAAYALKLLQSDGHLSIATTAKDPDTGKMRAHRYEVEGPVALVMTTTAFDLDPELLSRAIVLTVDESTEQTARIHGRQRRSHTMEGLRDAARRAALLELHQDAQRLLDRVLVLSPAGLLDAYGDLRVRARRDYAKLLTLVESLAVLHQHQRTRGVVEVGGEQVEYVSATPEDVALARRLLDGVTPGLDELPRHTAGVFERVVAFVEARAPELSLRPREFRFRRRELAARMPLSPTQLKLHIRRLVEAELLLRHATEDGGIAYSVRVFPCDYDEGGAGGESGGGRGEAGLGETSKTEVISGASPRGGRPRGQKQDPPSRELSKRTHILGPEGPGERR